MVGRLHRAGYSSRGNLQLGKAEMQIEIAFPLQQDYSKWKDL
jgi:hypothetical protein